MTPRGFNEIDVRNFSSQTKEQRFPKDDGVGHNVPFGTLDPTDLDNDDSDDDDDDNELPLTSNTHSTIQQPPRIAHWRSNLVALSQTDNLYFAAYQDKVHVTTPRGLKQHIGGEPDLILDLPQSAAGIRIGGYIDRPNGHFVNHLIVGNFGRYEIVLVACDDGDIISYYTHTIVAAIRSSLQPEIRPWLHENVGISAWGLGIHKQSRMVAVGSNKREVTVFIPAYSKKGSEGSGPGLFEGTPEKQQPTYPQISNVPESYRTHRWNSFRRVLKLGPEGHNIPSVDFASACDGEADSVVATDISGNTWILDVWGRPDKKITRIPSIQREGGDGTMGWGALVLPLSMFKHTPSPEEAMGIERVAQLACKTWRGRSIDGFFNASPAVRNIKDSSIWHPNWKYNIDGHPQVDSSSNEASNPPIDENGLVPEEEEDLAIQGSEPDPERFLYPGMHQIMCTIKEQKKHRASDIIGRRAFEAMVNSRTMTGQQPRRDTVTRLTAFNIALNDLSAITAMRMPKEALDTATIPELAFRLQDQSAILRTYGYDLELIPPTECMPKTLCEKVVKQELHRTAHHLAHYERLNMLAKIPELSLVIVGSQVGRVALITLTRPEDWFSESGPVVMFRVDRILPGKKHEDQKLRPNTPLMGMATSPLQGSRRIWRLILHYYDHTILTYELRRDDETDDLLVL